MKRKAQAPRSNRVIAKRFYAMPVIFDPPECVVITDRSPVAAGRIVNVSPTVHKLLSSRMMIVSVTLSTCQFRFRSHLLSSIGHSIFRRSACAESLAFCCLDFPGRTVWYTPRIRVLKVQLYYIIFTCFYGCLSP